MSKKRPADPYAAREAQKYDNPIPSREFILELLEKEGRPLSREDIASALKLHDEESLEALRRRLILLAEADGRALTSEPSHET